jgi:hypothetical protein
VTEFDGDFSGLRALFINCRLKRSPELSNTQGLVDISAGIMEKHGLTVEIVRAFDHDIATSGNVCSTCSRTFAETRRTFSAGFGLTTYWEQTAGA